MRTLLKLLYIAVCCSVTLAATGCAQYKDPRDAAWDPKGHSQLFDQIPNWDGQAERLCCGHLRSCKSYQSPRC
jgi:hypothetical protein